MTMILTASINFPFFGFRMITQKSFASDRLLMCPTSHKFVTSVEHSSCCMDSVFFYILNHY